MKLFKKLFAEKILRFYEGTESGIKILRSLPLVKNLIKDTAFGEKSKGRTAVGIISQIFILLSEFLKKFLYVLLLIHIPYVIMSHYYPLIKMHQDLTVIFLFVMLSTVCGTLSNTTIFATSDRDYLMVRILLVSPYMNFLGKLIYKLTTEFVFNLIVLLIFRVSFVNALMLCLLTMFVRPIGEMFAILVFDHLEGIYENRNVLNGTVMAICVIIAYALPMFRKTVSHNWIYAVHPFVVFVSLILGSGAMLYLWWYKYYRVIVRTAMHKKRED